MEDKLNIGPRKISSLFIKYQDLIFPENEYTYTEIFPKVFIYKNFFTSPEKITKVLKESTKDKNNSPFFSDWSQWGGFDSPQIFGEYIAWLGKDFEKKIYNNEQIKRAKLEFNIIEEVIKSFFASTNHFMKKQNIKKDNNWTNTSPSFCRYIAEDQSSDRLLMRLHTDYIIDSASEPGDKFAITTTMYFNDDYKGGEIIFKDENSLLKYKPEAGDLLVFPSGHPSILMEGEKPIMHGVNPIKKEGSDRYIVRMFHQIKSKGEDIERILSEKRRTNNDKQK